MAALDNPYIIRMIGLCKSDWMLILEYAPLGPLKDYLRRHKMYRQTYAFITVAEQSNAVLQLCISCTLRIQVTDEIRNEKCCILYEWYNCN